MARAARGGSTLGTRAGTRPSAHAGPAGGLLRAHAGLLHATAVAKDGNGDAGRGDGPEDGREERWESRPVLSLLVRLLAWAIPVLMSVLAAFVMSRLLPRPADELELLIWWIVMLAASTLVLVAVDRLARRLLPLATLLKLSLAFSDRAPDRFWVAFRAGTLRNLEERTAQARQPAPAEDRPDAAAHILTLMGALTLHDRRTRGHSERVRAFNDLLADEMRLSQHDRDRLRWAALLHDIGKLHTSPRILNKPDHPSPGEWEVIRRHPEDGARMIAPLRNWLGPWADTVEQHHERWDGTGYPLGLAREEISLGARIVAVADAFEVMTAPRPYRRPVSADAAREELARRAGRDFDPLVVRAFLNISLGKLRAVMGPISWLAQLPILGSFPPIPAGLMEAARQALTTVGAVTGVAILAASGALPGGSGTAGADPNGKPARPELPRANGAGPPPRNGSATGQSRSLEAELHGPVVRAAAASNSARGARIGLVAALHIEVQSTVFENTALENIVRPAGQPADPAPNLRQVPPGQVDDSPEPKGPAFDPPPVVPPPVDPPPVPVVVSLPDTGGGVDEARATRRSRGRKARPKPPPPRGRGAEVIGTAPPRVVPPRTVPSKERVGGKAHRSARVRGGNGRTSTRGRVT